MTVSTYIDTSALAKRYVAERGSDEFETFVQAQGTDCVICQLATVELESLLRRLQRERLIDSGYAMQVRRDFASDMASALWSMQAFDAACFARANELLRALDAPLAALDALHLASAVEFGCDSLATGDQQLARAAAECGLTVYTFD